MSRQPGSATKAERISRPSSVRIGIACRFGFEVESRPAVLVRDEARQRLEVGVQELRVLTPLLDHGDDLVVAADRAQDARVGRVARLALPPGRQLELLEEDPRDLLRRAEHELLARELVGPRLELLETVME